MKELFLDTEPRVTLGNLIGQLQQKLKSNDLPVEAILDKEDTLILSVLEDPTVQLRPE